MDNKIKYKKLIANFKDRNLAFSKNWHEDSYKNKILLRHDIDFSVESAQKIAIIEDSLGIKASYFFMITSNFYNIFSKINIQRINEIKEMGHNISLHFDPTVHDSLESFKIEKKIFESIFNIKMDIVSVHRPNNFLNNSNDELFGVKHTYMDHYFKHINYISDSGGRDIFKPVEKYLKDGFQNGLQLLLHPIWWDYDNSTPTNKLDSWKKKNDNFLTDEIRLNCKTYKG